MDDESIKCIRMRLEDTREYYQAGMEGYDTQVLHDDACRLLAEVERLRADAARRFVLMRMDGYDTIFLVPFGFEAKARKHIKAWEEWSHSMTNACGRPRRVDDAGPEPLKPEWLIEFDPINDKLTVALPQITRRN